MTGREVKHTEWLQSNRVHPRLWHAPRARGCAPCWNEHSSRTGGGLRRACFRFRRLSNCQMSQGMSELCLIDPHSSLTSDLHTFKDLTSNLVMPEYCIPMWQQLKIPCLASTESITCCCRRRLGGRQGWCTSAAAYSRPHAHRQTWPGCLVAPWLPVPPPFKRFNLGCKPNLNWMSTIFFYNTVNLKCIICWISSNSEGFVLFGQHYGSVHYLYGFQGDKAKDKCQS